MKAITNQIPDNQTSVPSSPNPTLNDTQDTDATNFFSAILAAFFGAKQQVTDTADMTPVGNVITDTTNSTDDVANTNPVVSVEATVSQPLMMLPAEAPIPSLQQNKPLQPEPSMLNQLTKPNVEVKNKINLILNQTVAAKPLATTTTQAITYPEHTEIPAKIVETMEDLFKQNTNEAVQQPFTEGQLQEIMHKLPSNNVAKPETTINLTNNMLPDINLFQSISNKANMVTNTAKINVEQLAAPKNKFTDALIQLGQFINTQTTQEFTKADTTTVVNSQMTYTEALHKVPEGNDYGLKIEVQAANLDSQTKEIYNANIKIYPPELGAVVAKLKVGKNGTELMILTENTAVKSIVEANLAQLRQDFKQADINLTNIQIDVQTPQSGQKEHQNQNQNNYSAEPDGGLNTLVPKQPNNSSATSTQVINSIIDTYA